MSHTLNRVRRLHRFLKTSIGLLYGKYFTGMGSTSFLSSTKINFRKGGTTSVAHFLELLRSAEKRDFRLARVWICFGVPEFEALHEAITL